MKPKIKRKIYASGYKETGASTTRRALRSFIPNSGAPEIDIDENLSVLRQRARMLYMSSPMATSAIQTNRTKVVGTGLTVKSTIDRDVLGITEEAAEDWQKKTENEFRLWAEEKKNCDATGMNNFCSMQQLVIKSELLSGDVFAVVKRAQVTQNTPYSLRLHIVEADRVCTPVFRGKKDGDFELAVSLLPTTEGVVPEGYPGSGNKIHDGVEVDAEGKVVAYYIADRYPGSPSVKKGTTWARVEAYGEKTEMPNILHVVNTERPDQYRGVPYLAQVIEPLLQMRRYTESEMMAAIVQSYFTAWIETEDASSKFPLNEVGAGDVVGSGTNETYNEDSGEETEEEEDEDNEYEMGPGVVSHLKKGEKIVFGNPNIPTAGFDVFVKSMCKSLGAALEMPYDVLVKEFNSSYSASRGALIEAWEAFKMRRKWLVDGFCQPVYELWLAEAVAIGRVKAPGFFTDPAVRKAWTKAQWIGPVQGQLDPKKEAQASLTQAAVGVKTYEQVTRELGGGDFRANIEQLAREHEKMREAGIMTVDSNGAMTSFVSSSTGEEKGSAETE